jgi:hypothetical protein
MAALQLVPVQSSILPVTYGRPDTYAKRGSTGGKISGVLLFQKEK